VITENENNKNGLLLPIVEEFYTIQGEGYHTGKAAYFIRIGGCDIGCKWCDTKFSWNADVHPVVAIDSIINNVLDCGADSVVVTGGEPLMWNLDPLCSGLHSRGIKTFLETSGAYPLSGEWDWIALSPKKGMPPADSIWDKANELKVIIENENDFSFAENYRKKVSATCRLFLQPEWSRYNELISTITEYVKKNTMWRVSLQSHKFMHVP
jgi:7-carboxy-7-deazaguanine synthase